MQAWQRAFRLGIAPQLSTVALVALKTALECDDKRLIQTATTSPPPIQTCQSWPVEAACPVGLCGWLGQGLTTVGEVEDFFALTCARADQLLGEPAAVRYFFAMWDTTPRERATLELLSEVNRVLVGRGELAVAAA